MRSPGAYIEPPESVRQIIHERMLAVAINIARSSGQPWAANLTRAEIDTIAAYLAAEVAFMKSTR